MPLGVPGGKALQGLDWTLGGFYRRRNCLGRLVSAKQCMDVGAGQHTVKGVCRAVLLNLSKGSTCHIKDGVAAIAHWSRRNMRDHSSLGRSKVRAALVALSSGWFDVGAVLSYGSSQALLLGPPTCCCFAESCGRGHWGYSRPCSSYSPGSRRRGTGREVHQRKDGQLHQRRSFLALCSRHSVYYDLKKLLHQCRCGMHMVIGKAHCQQACWAFFARQLLVWRRDQRPAPRCCRFSVGKLSA